MQIKASFPQQLSTARGTGMYFKRDISSSSATVSSSKSCFAESCGPITSQGRLCRSRNCSTFSSVNSYNSESTQTSSKFMSYSPMVSMMPSSIMKGPSSSSCEISLGAFDSLAFSTSSVPKIWSRSTLIAVGTSCGTFGMFGGKEAPVKNQQEKAGNVRACLWVLVPPCTPNVFWPSLLQHQHHKGLCCNNPAWARAPSRRLNIAESTSGALAARGSTMRLLFFCFFFPAHLFDRRKSQSLDRKCPPRDA